MGRLWSGRLAAAILIALLAGPAAAASAIAESLVFGSFRSEANAVSWAAELTRRFDGEFHIERVHRDDGVWYRVRTAALKSEELQRLRDRARQEGLAVWMSRSALQQPATITASTEPEQAPEDAGAPGAEAFAPAAQTRSRAPPEEREQQAAVRSYTDIDVGLQSRAYRLSGLDGQGRFHPSLSARLEYRRSWNDGRSELKVVPFARLDVRDSERTHADLRELYYTRIGPDWELHIGARQIFWGVTEFKHLVDIINQTDLVEDIDGEEKLGQPMMHLSLVRDWGILDLFLLTGFRERTFPGDDGRLRIPLSIDTDDAWYESGAGRRRVDGAVRWSHHLGPLSFGLHHFSGTGRDPQFGLVTDGDGNARLRPEYHVIDQTGIDGQAIFGDWVWKLEALRRSGGGERYYAYNAGFERTLVGAFGTRADLGVVVEYLYDDRGARAYNTLFENDLALGLRWQANDLADTTALFGYIRDVDTSEYVVSLEAQRRLGTAWQVSLEARWFGGAPALRPELPLDELLGGRVKSRALQRDDYLQLELTRFF